MPEVKRNFVFSNKRAAKSPWEDADYCPHRAALGSAEPCFACQEATYARGKEKLRVLEQTRGKDDVATLEAMFDFFHALITSYRLSECDEVLSRFFDACKKRTLKEKNDTFYIQMIQATAFLRYKQSRFKECCELFEEMQTLIGLNDRLLENMGNAYNSIGDYKKAQECFHKALEVIDLKPPEEQARCNRGGILLGLAMIQKSAGNFQDALKTLLEGLQVLQQRNKGDHSIVAKASSYVGEVLEELGRFDEAEPYYVESVRVFRLTCGDNSPDMQCTTPSRRCVRRTEESQGCRRNPFGSV